MNALNQLASNYREATYTAVLAVVLLCSASSAAWLLSRNQNRETQRLWQLTFRHLAALGFMLGLGVIWKSELRAVLLALGAATAGFLVTFRESWLSLLAFWTRVIKRHYSLNDYIEIDGVRGKVIDITWLTTTVAESVPGREGTMFSGKVVHIPNNRMLLSALTVDNLTDEYTLHVLTVPLPKSAHPLVAEQLLLEVAAEHCRPYLDEARKHMKQLEEEKAIELSAVEPKAFLSIGEDGAVTIRVRITVPQAVTGRVHQAILHDFFRKADVRAWPRQGDVVAKND